GEHEAYRRLSNGMGGRRAPGRRFTSHDCEALRVSTTGIASTTLVVRRSGRDWSRPEHSATPALMAAKTPEDCATLFERHLNAGDLDALADLYEPDAVLVPNPGESAVGRKAIRETLGGFVAAKAEIRLRVGQVLRAGDDLALIYGDWSGHFTDPDGARVAIA